MWFKLLCCVFICCSQCIIQLKGFQLWKKYSVNQQLQISVKVVIYPEGAATSITPLSFLEKGPTRQLAAGRFRRKTKQKRHYYNVNICNTWIFSKYCKSHLLFRRCVTFEAAVTCFLGPCALTGPLCWVCPCCIITCMTSCVSDENSWCHSPSSAVVEPVEPRRLLFWRVKNEERTWCLATANRQ